MKKLLAFALLAGVAGCSSDGGAAADDDDGATGLGCRPVAISSGEDGEGNSTYLSSVFPGEDLSEFLVDEGGWAEETITLCAGVIASDGTAVLTLQEDATEAVSLPQNNCLCRQLLAAGSTGTLYCAASANFLDFTSTQDSMDAGAAGPVAIVEGPGTVPGEGHARLTLSAKTTGIDANAAACTVATCAAALVGVTVADVLYTKGTATSEFTNTAAGTKTVAATGRSFGACEDWASPSSAGALAGAPEHDEDNPSAGDVVTIERIAEKP